MKPMRALFWSWALFGASAVASPLSPPLELSDVLSSVDTRYPAVSGAIQDRAKAEGDLLSAKGGFDPVLRFSYQTTPSGEYENRYFDLVAEQPTGLWGLKAFAGYRNGQGSFGPYDERLLTKPSGEVRAGLEIPLLRGGPIDDRRARIALAERGVAAMDAGIGAQRLDARKQASQKYFEWIAAGEKAKIARSLLKLARDRDEAMSVRVKRGDAAQIEQADNHRSVLQREAALIAAERALAKAAIELSLFYRDEQGAPIVAQEGRLPPRGFPPFSSTSESPGAKTRSSELTAHPELARLSSQVEQNEIERRLSANLLFPKLDAEVLAAQDLGSGGGPKAIFEYKAALKLEIPLLFRAGRGKVEAASAAGLKLEFQRELALNRLQAGASDATQAMEAAESRHRIASEELALALKVEQAERIKLGHGDSNLVTVNIREQATADARVRAIDAFSDYYRAWADLEAAIGQLPRN